MVVHLYWVRPSRNDKKTVVSGCGPRFRLVTEVIKRLGKRLRFWGRIGVEEELQFPSRVGCHTAFSELRDRLRRHRGLFCQILSERLFSNKPRLVAFSSAILASGRIAFRTATKSGNKGSDDRR